MTVCALGVVVVVVDAHHDGDVLVLRRRRDDDLLGAAVDVRAGLGGVGEEAGRLDDDVGAEVAPLQGGGVALGERLDLLVADVDRVVGRGHVGVEPAEDRVVLEQVGQDALSVRSLTPTISMSAPRGAHGAEEVAADAAEAVDAYADGHCECSCSVAGVSGALTDAAYRPCRRPYRQLPSRRPSAYVPVTDRARSRSGVVGEHLRRQRRLGVGDAELLGPLVGHRQQPADPAGDRVLGEHRVVQLAELLEARPACARAAARRPAAGGRAPRRRGSPAPARPGHRRRPRPARSGAGWRRRSWRAGWRWPGPRAASGAPPRPSATRGRRAG